MMANQYSVLFYHDGKSIQCVVLGDGQSVQSNLPYLIRPKYQSNPSYKSMVISNINRDISSLFS